MNSKLKWLVSLIFVYVIVLQTAISQPSNSKNALKIIGEVVDNTNDLPLEFATISIFTHDSALVTGGLVGTDGSFSVDVNPGRYYAIVQFISYQQQVVSDIVISPAKGIFNIGRVSLSPESTNLDEVTVTAEKSEMVIHLDKKIFNVGKDLSNTGKSALDIMENIPSVNVDLDGNISLRGSQSLQILIDGKPSGMVNAGNTDALRNIQGSMIERVELITNPSARYEAEGMAGIINIVLKKDQQKGVNGTFEATLGHPQEYSLGANVNFRRKKINYFLNYNIRYNERPGSGYSNQYFTRSDTSYTTKMDRDRLRSGLSNRIRGGADFFINPKNTLTGAFLFGYNNQKNTTNLLYKDYTPSEMPIQSTNRQDIEKEGQVDFEGSLLYEKTFDTKEHKFTALVQYINDSETERSGINETIMKDTAYGSGIEYSRDTVENMEKETNLLIQLDYIHPFGNEGKFEAGYRGEFRNITNDYFVGNLNNEGEWERDSLFSNEFEYIENIHGIYAQAGNSINRFSLQAGLRVEISNVKTFLKETNERNNTIYADFFPTLHTTYQFNEKNSMQLSYSRRITRPHFRMLNPFSNYTDPRNIRTGNPNLKPEYTHSFETGYLVKLDKLNFYSGIYYRFTTGVFERVSFVDDSGITYLTTINLSERQSFGVEANSSVDFFKWWTLSADINFFRYIVDGEYEGKNLSSDDYSWNTRLNSRMRFPGNIDFQTIFFYRAPSESTQGTQKAFYMLNMAISKDILKGKGTLTFNVQDVLNSRKFRFIYDQPDLYSESEFRWSQRSYTLTFLYLLNQKKRPGKGNGEQNGDNFGGDDMGF